MSTVGQLGERALLERIRLRVPAGAPGVLVGVGDDAAVVAPARGHALVVTTDAQVEGVHFDPWIVPFEAVGHRALAASLSDLAAMGARPGPAVLSLALPVSLEVTAVDRLLDGLLGLAARFDVPLVGGNLARSPAGLIVDVTALGFVRRRRILTRAGARPGDDVWVSGTLGAAAAGLEWLRSRSGTALADPQLDDCVERFLRPEPRVRLGRALAGHRAATACIDLSDGLADGVHQLARASRVGVVLDAGAVPIAPGARAWFGRRGDPPFAAAVAGGEDYELLFTASPRHRRRLAAVQRLGRVSLTRIGKVVADRGIVVREDGDERDVGGGFDHFAPSAACSR